VLYGDVPLIQAETLKQLLHAARDALAILTVELADPAGYGRIVRNAAGEVVRIVEQKDATPRSAHPRNQYRHHGPADGAPRPSGWAACRTTTRSRSTT
jgi:hypothetical protein